MIFSLKLTNKKFESFGDICHKIQHLFCYFFQKYVCIHNMKACIVCMHAVHLIVPLTTMVAARAVHCVACVACSQVSAAGVVLLRSSRRGVGAAVLRGVVCNTNSARASF